MRWGCKIHFVATDATATPIQQFRSGKKKKKVLSLIFHSNFLQLSIFHISDFNKKFQDEMPLAISA